jgi:hypothetical protein
VKAPTDLELMMYADGELDEARAGEIARFLAADGSDSTDGASAKLFGLSLVGTAVRAQADQLADTHGAVDIADLVMQAAAKADALPEGGSDADASEETSKLSRAERVERVRARAGLRVVEGEGGAGQRAAERGRPDVPAEPERAPSEASSEPGGPDRRRSDVIPRVAASGTERPAANDNHRLIYGIAAIAAAAAIGLGYWGRSAPAPALSGREPIVHEIPSVNEVARIEPSASPVGSQVASASGPSGDAETEPSVKVAAVDFGANTGAIYYVPRETPGGGAVTAGATTVVWLADR